MNDLMRCNDCGSTDVSKIEKTDLVNYYRDLLESGDLDMSIQADEYTPWCYLSQFTGTHAIDDAEHIPYALEALCKCVYTPVLQLSVTSQEDHYKVWLDCIKGIPGHTIFEYDRGGYTVYLCTFPVNPTI